MSGSAWEPAVIREADAGAQNTWVGSSDRTSLDRDEPAAPDEVLM